MNQYSAVHVDAKNIPLPQLSFLSAEKPDRAFQVSEERANGIYSPTNERVAEPLALGAFPYF